MADDYDELRRLIAARDAAIKAVPAEIARLVATDHPVQEVADVAGVNRETVRRIRKEHGVPDGRRNNRPVNRPKATSD